MIVVEVKMDDGMWEPVYHRPFNDNETDHAQDELKECRTANRNAEYRLSYYRRTAVVKELKHVKQ